MPTHCHKLIAEVAKEMAHELYDTMMQDNEWYEIWKKRWPRLHGSQLEVKFVTLNWPRLIGQARATLASMLAGNYPESEKEKIHEALVLDASIPGRASRFQPATRLLH